jgi:PAS domain S-box-containing protein
MQREETFRMVADWTYDWEYWIGPEGEIIYTSPSVERITEYPADMFTANPDLLDDLVYPPDRHFWESHVGCRDESRNKEVSELKFRILTLSGNIRWIHHICRPVFANDGNYLGRRISNRDITERIQMEERIQRLEKFEALGRIAGNVAHDLNSELGIMVGYSELIVNDVDESSPMQRHLKAIMDAGYRAAAIVQDLLIMSQKDIAIREVLKLNTVIMDYLATPAYIQLAASQIGIRLVTKLDSKLMNIQGSADHLSRVVMNLVINAMEAIEDTGIVTIKTGSRYLEVPMLGYEEIAAGNYVVLSISDTGRGISPEDMKKVFEPFYTTKRMRLSGSGLGLPVVWGVVKNHGGFIDLRSEQGKGTTFELYFPEIDE